MAIGTIPSELEKDMASDGFHESASDLSDQTRDMHRALQSLIEELEAVDWYNQRADACRDEELKGIIAHNRDEEKEHAAMLLEWIRRRDPAFSHELKDYVFSSEPIVELESGHKDPDHATDEGHEAH